MWDERRFQRRRISKRLWGPPGVQALYGHSPQSYRVRTFCAGDARGQVGTVVGVQPCALKGRGHVCWFLNVVSHSCV